MQKMEYEELVAAIAHLDAALGVLEPRDVSEVSAIIHEARNDLNHQRLELLGNGQERPFDVFDLVFMQEGAK